MAEKMLSHNVKWPESDLKNVKAIAKGEGENVSTFVRKSAKQRIKRIERENSINDISEKVKLEAHMDNTVGHVIRHIQHNG